MNKHLTKYLTHENPLLRNWVKSRIHLTDKVYEVIKGTIDYIPEENQYVCGIVNINDKELKAINRTVLYCERLICSNNKLTKLPELPVCEYIDCGDNQLTDLPDLPVCEHLICNYNQLIIFPELPRCVELYCDHNKLTKLPKLPVCEHLDCYNNQLTSLPNLPVCNTLYCEDNPGYPFK